MLHFVCGVTGCLAPLAPCVRHLQGWLRVWACHMSMAHVKSIQNTCAYAGVCRACTTGAHAAGYQICPRAFSAMGKCLLAGFTGDQNTRRFDLALHLLILSFQQLGPSPKDVNLTKLDAAACHGNTSIQGRHTMLCVHGAVCREPVAAA